MAQEYYDPYSDELTDEELYLLREQEYNSNSDPEYDAWDASLDSFQGGVQKGLGSNRHGI
jgi:hypothetical protein